MQNNFYSMEKGSTFVSSGVNSFRNGYTTKITKDKEGLIPERALREVTSLFLPPLRFITSKNSDK